jgi:hypothetical protein
VFPTSAGLHTSELFFTDNDGTYFFPTRDGHPPLEIQEGKVDLEAFLMSHKARIRRLSNNRMDLPRSEPYMEGHNTWIGNHEGSTLVIPVGDIAQHYLATIGFYTQNGYPIYDDLAKKPIPGIEKFRNLVDVGKALPLSYMEFSSLTECTAEMATSCYAGMLMLQAMGLGGWMYDGLDRLSVLGASGDPNVPGLGFRYDRDERWALANPTGLPGVFEGYSPPHYKDMRAATEALIKRKFGPRGVFNPETPGPYRETANVRGSVLRCTDEFKECVALQAQYVYDTYGKFPATVPTIFITTYLQAQHIDLDFYNRHFKPGAYLGTHKRHMDRWH